jgi:hypothetical protein
MALWSGNHSAQEGIVEASLAYASSALRKGDFDLAATLLDPNEPSHVPSSASPGIAQQERDSRQKRLQAAKRLAGAAGAGRVDRRRRGLFLDRSERDKALIAEQDAIEKREEAIKRSSGPTKRPKDNGSPAAAARAAEADQRKERKKAEIRRQRHVGGSGRGPQRQQAEREAYVARIGLAAAKIEENAFQRARELLAECPPALRDWEWGRLMYLCQQHVREIDNQQPIETVAFSPDGRHFVTGGWDGVLRIWETDTGELQSTIPTGGPVCVRRGLLARWPLSGRRHQSLARLPASLRLSKRASLSETPSAATATRCCPWFFRATGSDC